MLIPFWTVIFIFNMRANSPFPFPIALKNKQ